MTSYGLVTPSRLVPITADTIGHHPAGHRRPRGGPRGPTGLVAGGRKYTSDGPCGRKQNGGQALPGPRGRHRGPLPNVDFCTATVYHYLGIPTDLFTGVFSVSRMAGRAAHVMEQHADNRLIRPDSEYIGERALTWIPLGER